MSVPRRIMVSTRSSTSRSVSSPTRIPTPTRSAVSPTRAEFSNSSGSGGGGSSSSSSSNSSSNRNNSNNGSSNNNNMNKAISSPPPARKAQGWSHAPTSWTLIWLLISLPLVAWDTGYVLLRPWTMPGGHLHSPLWTPYALYGEVDHVYGWKAFNAGNGFTSAQGTLNVVETVMYLVYLWLWRSRGRLVDGGASGQPSTRKVVGGRAGALAVVIGFSAAVMTFSKTVLYWLNEYYSGFDNIGHNAFRDLLFLWIIPNGAWLLGSGYMIVSMGGEILDGLTLASKTTKTE